MDLRLIRSSGRDNVGTGSTTKSPSSPAPASSTSNNACGYHGRTDLTLTGSMLDSPNSVPRSVVHAKNSLVRATIVSRVPPASRKQACASAANLSASFVLPLPSTTVGMWCKAAMGMSSSMSCSSVSKAALSSTSQDCLVTRGWLSGEHWATSALPKS
eukprot:7928425-Alexandrium_andersonii.AAC.1